MIVLLYFEDEQLIRKSGVGRAFEHQKRALASAGIEYTTDPRSTDYDILHINTYGVNSGFVVRKARQLGKPVIYHAHSTKEDFMNSFRLSNVLAPFVKYRLVHLYNSADVLITPTPYSKRLLESYGLRLPIYAISNGIDLDAYEVKPSNISAFREYFGIKPAEKVVIGVGLLFERKGILDFLEVARNMPDVRFIWFGDISRLLLPGKILNAIDHCSDNVIFPGYITGNLMKGAFAGADAFFFPSYEENEGIVVLEALASKQTAIIRDIGAYDAFAVNGKNCYLGHNNKEFETILRRVLDGSLPRTDEQGYLVAKERSIDEIGAQLRAVYTSLLK